MQMKNDRGITLIALIVTILVLGIVLAISLDYGSKNVDKIENKKIESELSMVQQAIVQQYAWAKNKNELGKIANSIYEDTNLSSDTNRPKDLIGTRISDVVTLQKAGFKNFLVKYDATPKSQANLTYEQYYYEITKDDLKLLKINEDENSAFTKDHTYIVNYYTGEVFDTKNKTYKKTEVDNGDPVYLPGTNTKVENPDYTFNDD